MKVGKKLVFGSDWGGTINNNEYIVDGSRNSLLNPKQDARGFLRVKPFKGCLETFRWLHEHDRKSIIVSRVVLKQWVVNRVILHLDHSGFCTFVPLERVFFCKTYEQKASICEGQGVTHFVDNHLPVLVPMIGKIPNLYLFRPPPDMYATLWHHVESGRVTVVKSWGEIRERLQEWE